MIAPVFVDANVLVYLRDATNAIKQSRAADWMDRLWRERSGRTSMQVLSEFYVTATRKLRPVISNEIAWSFVESLLAWQPQPIDGALLQRAREIEQRHRLSWWDSMVVAAAQLQDCAVLLTEDMHDGAVFGGVTVRSPFTLAVEEPREQYEIASTAQSHPPRGRPRKQGNKSREVARS
jgi:predicted nucleic acid-binding protein